MRRDMPVQEFSVDYIVGPTTLGVYGIKRYQDEIHGRMPSARLNRIEYIASKNRLAAIAKKLFFPLSVLFSLKKGNVKHITTQYLAYLCFLPGMGNSIVTVYDTVFIERKNDFPFFTRILISADIAGIRRAGAVITISDYSAAQIEKLLGVPKEKIFVVKPGMDLKFFTRRAHEPEKWGAKGKPVILSLGSEDPRQNVDKVMKAVALLKNEYPSIRMLKAGNPQWKGGRESLVSLSEKLGISERVLFLGYVPEEKLPSLYSSADVFVYPCSSTGWGLPPAEAMACGTPTVASRVPPLPEVVGDGAFLVNPESEEEIAAAIRRLLEESKLRAKLAKNAKAHLSKFSWGKAAKETENVYRKVLE